MVLLQNRLKRVGCFFLVGQEYVNVIEELNQFFGHFKRPHDYNFDSGKFETALAVFPTNDVKYEVNKLRAHGYATHRGHVIMYCPAIDTQRMLV